MWHIKIMKDIQESGDGGVKGTVVTERERCDMAIYVNLYY